MSASITAALGVRGRGGRAAMPMIEIAVPPQRASLDPAAGALRSSTVLVVAPGHAAWAPLTAGMLEMGIGRVLRAESSAAVDAIIEHRPPGDLALVSTALGNKTGKVVRRLRAAGWRRVLALATGADPTPVVSALLAEDVPGLGTEHGERDLRKEHHLSRRQVAVLHCLAQGLSVKQIARGLGISRSAVKRDVGHIGDELGARKVAEMAAAGVRAGLIA